MNILVIIMILILIWRIGSGVKNGLVKEIISLITLIILCSLAITLSFGVYSFMQKDYVSLAIAAIVVIVIIIGYKLLDFFFFTAKMVTKIPVLSSLNKVLGALIGIVETVIIVWLMFAILNIFDMKEVEIWIWQQVDGNFILNYLRELYHQYPGKMITQFSSSIGETMQEILPLEEW